MTDYYKKYLKYKKKYMNIKKNIGGENKISNVWNDIDSNKCIVSKNLTEYRVVFDNVHFYIINNGEIIQDKDIVPINESYTGSLIFIKDNIYVDLGNDYIPVFDKDTGDILVTTQHNKCIKFTNIKTKPVLNIT